MISQEEGTPVSDYMKALGAYGLGADPSPEAVEALLLRWSRGLARSTPLRIQVERQTLVHDIGLPARVVDAAIDSKTTGPSTHGGGGRVISITDPDPWPTAVDGAELLDEIRTTFSRFLILPKGASSARALWTLHAHAHDAFEVSPLLAVTSPEKRCGKSTVLQLLLGLVPRAIPAVNLTSASVFRVVESYRPTLLVDEGDSFLAGREDLRGILNSGHCRRMAFVPRCAGDTHEPRLFSTWAPKAIALIGKLADRSIEIRMRRRATGEKVDRVRAQLLDRHIPLQRKAWPFVVHDLGQYRWMRASSGLAL